MAGQTAYRELLEQTRAFELEVLAGLKGAFHRRNPPRKLASAARSAMALDAGRNVSIALPANIRLSVHDALTSLEMGLLPIQQFSGVAGAQYRNPADPELRLDLLTPATRASKTVLLEELGLALERIELMEFLWLEPRKPWCSRVRARASSTFPLRNATRCTS